MAHSIWPVQRYLLLSSSTKDCNRRRATSRYQALELLELLTCNRYAVDRHDHISGMESELRECAAIAAGINPDAGHWIA